MWTLGINAPPWGWHDTAACLIDSQGAVVAFGEEERFTGVKHGLHQPPKSAVSMCLDRGAIEMDDVDVVAVGWDFPRLSTQHGSGWRFDSASELLATLGWPRRRNGRCPEVVFVSHHRAHAFCSFYSSGWRSAAVLIADGEGEDEAISIYSATESGHIVRRRSWPRSHSLGYIYSAASTVIGFSFLEAGKTVGLSAYGRARGVQPQHLVDLEPEFAPTLSLTTDVDYGDALAAWQAVMLSGSAPPTRDWLHRLDEHHQSVAVAWSAQNAIETSMAWLAQEARNLTGESRLCIGGGVGLNCAANGRISGSVYAPPIPYDAGVALGAAWAVVAPAKPHQLSPYLGLDVRDPCGRPTQLRGSLTFRDFDPARVTEMLSDGALGAVVDGRAEVGPRALCHRSIIAAPRPESQRTALNDVKQREQWRPFAPVAPAALDGVYWEPVRALGRYMIGAQQVTAEGMRVLPATTHIDGTTRPQLLKAGDAPIVESILSELESAGEPAVLLNTSFNSRGQPIVNDASQAIATFESLELDFLVVGDLMTVKDPKWI